MTHRELWIESAKLKQNYLLIDLNFMSPEAKKLQTAFDSQHFFTTASGKERVKELQA